MERERQEHKLAPIEDGPYKLVSTTPTTIIILVNGRVERVFFDRVFSVPSPSGKIRKEGRKREGPIGEERPIEEQSRATNTMEPTQVVLQEYVVQRIFHHQKEREGPKLRIQW